MTRTGWFVVHDALTLAPASGEDGTDEHARNLGPHDAEHLLVRTVECVARRGRGGDDLRARLRLRHRAHELDARGRGPPGRRRQRRGFTVRLLGDIPLDIDGACARGVRALRSGERCFSCLSWREELGGPRHAADAVSRIDTTIQLWRRWLEGGTFPDHPWRWTLQRSALALKGLTYEPTGAMVAALTTSLPETPGGERNWDYRYTWIRDATFTLWSLHVLGFDEEAREFMEFVCELFHGRRPDGRSSSASAANGADRKTLDRLSGYIGSKPVRIGNAALPAAPERRLRSPAGLDLHSLGDPPGVPEHLSARSASAGRGRVRPGTSRSGNLGGARRPKTLRPSKLMSWVALDRASRLARGMDKNEFADGW